MSTEQFYDDLAETYHALYPDWAAETRAQGECLDRLLARWHTGRLDIADVACGIGTQLIGLARLGHHLVGTDISAGALRRAARECEAAGVAATLAVADMRALPLDDGCVDAVVCADNALPHLLADDDALTALAEMRRVLRPGGTAVVTTRDYDRVVVERPTSTPPQVFESDGERLTSVQRWAWRPGTDVYDLEHVQVHEHRGGGTTTRRRVASYRAYTRSVLTELAARAGLQDVTWHAPDETGFFQPVMVAHALGVSRRTAPRG